MYSVAPTAELLERANLVMALASACSTYQFVSPSSFSHTLGKPVGVPLNPSAMIMRSLTIKAPTCLRTQCDNCAHSAAMRMYASS